MATVYAQLLLQCYTDLFDTLQVYFSLSAYLHEIRHFSGSNTTKVYKQWVPCVCNFYSFIPTILALYSVFALSVAVPSGLDIIFRLSFVTFLHFEFSHHQA